MIRQITIILLFIPAKAKWSMCPVLTLYVAFSQIILDRYRHQKLTYSMQMLLCRYFYAIIIRNPKREFL